MALDYPRGPDTPAIRAERPYCERCGPPILADYWIGSMARCEPCRDFLADHWGAPMPSVRIDRKDEA